MNGVFPNKPHDARVKVDIVSFHWNDHCVVSTSYAMTDTATVDIERL